MHPTTTGALAVPGCWQTEHIVLLLDFPLAEVSVLLGTSMHASTHAAPSAQAARFPDSRSLRGMLQHSGSQLCSTGDGRRASGHWQLATALRVCRSPHERWRFVVLDGYDISMLGWPEGHPNHQAAADTLARHNPNQVSCQHAWSSCAFDRRDDSGSNTYEAAIVCSLV